MNILYITNTDPRISSFGMEQRTHYLYEALKEKGNVYTLVIGPGGGKTSNNIIFAEIKEPSGLKGIIRNLLYKFYQRYFFEWVMTMEPFSMCNPAEYFPNIKFDIVVTRYLKIASQTQAWKYGKLYVDIDDDPMQVFKTLIAPHLNKSRIFAEHLLKTSLWLIERHLKGAWFSNPEQTQNILHKIPVKALPNLAPYINPNYNPNNTQREMAIMTVGRMEYPPNPLGIDCFLTDIWPFIHQKYPNLKYYIVGQCLNKTYSEKWEKIPNIKIMGYVENLDNLYEHILAVVVPINQGGGTCIKTLDALAHSRICLSTLFGARGIRDTTTIKSGLAIYNDANDFEELFNKIVIDELVRNICETNAKKYIDANYSFTSFKKAVHDIISSEQAHNKTIRTIDEECK